MKKSLLGICTVVLVIILFATISAFAGDPLGGHRPKFPEPGTLLLLGLGAAGAITAWRIKRGSKRK